MGTSPEGGGTGDLGGGLQQQSVGKTVRWRDPGGGGTPLFFGGLIQLICI